METEISLAFSINFIFAKISMLIYLFNNLKKDTVFVCILNSSYNLLISKLTLLYLLSSLLYFSLSYLNALSYEIIPLRNSLSSITLFHPYTLSYESTHTQKYIYHPHHLHLIRNSFHNSDILHTNKERIHYTPA